MTPPFRRTARIAVTILSATVLAACSSTTPASEGDPSASGSGPAPAPGLRLGYFPNLTHAAALVGIGDGSFEAALGEVPLTTTPFNSGTEATEAIFNDAIDMSFVGPSPAINAFAQSEGVAVRVIAGATSGGAALVVREGIDSVEDLEGATLATPSLGNTQDVALRAWLAEQGYETTVEGGGDVAITPLANSDTLAAFATGDLDGAWVPEPYATRLIVESGAHVLVDERDLWPQRRFVTTQLMVATNYLNDHPEQVKAVLETLVEITDRLNEDPEGTKEIVNAQLAELSGEPLADAVLQKAWKTLEFTVDPIADSLRQGAEHATTVGLLEEVDLEGLYDLTLLNEVLESAGKDPVTA